MWRIFAFIAQSTSEGGHLSPPPSGNPISLINERLRTNLDVLNHPDAMTEIVRQINLVWALIFIILGGLSVLNGYRWHKGIIIVLAALSGIWAGMALGAQVGDVMIAAACLSVLFAIIAWPLLRYSVAVFGGLAGAFAGANLWTAIGLQSELHYMGAMIGLIAVGMLAFMAFRAVVVLLTTVGGASLLVFGGLSAMMYIDSWENALANSLQSKPLILPLIVACAAGIGAVIQVGGGLKGLNEQADKADPVKQKRKAAA